MKDRAMQALHLLALDPIAESTADSNSYAFRKSRSTADAIEQCYCVLAKRSSPQWIYEGDIRSCFDEISQDWILSNIPMDKTILRKWLKAGYCYQQVWYPTDTGSPQGAIISPAISNMTLDGLEKELKSKFAPTEWIARRNQVNLVRYADDFIITGKTKELLEQEVKPLVESFLKARALTLSPSKTKITHISDGFDFLGKNIRKYNGKFLTKPSTKNVKAFLAKIRGIINGNLHTSVSKLIIKLNPIIKGWAQYHRYSASKSTFAKVDSKIFWMLWSWAKRRHPKKSKNWIKKKYFHSTPTRNWVFQVPLLSQSKVKSYLTLNRAMDMPISRQIKIKGEANPYDPAWESYFEDRLRHQMVVNFRERKRLLRLWFDQEGICPICSQKITKDTDWNIHHILWRVVGGKDTLNNLVLLHPNCHRQVHSLGLSVSKPRPLKRASREA
jgi:RNA-directed DNA polymerase